MDLEEADVAEILEEIKDKDTVKIFRLLPKDRAADVFSLLDIDNQQVIIDSLTDKEAAYIVDEMAADDAADLIDELPSNVVKRILSNTTPETRKDINHLLKFPDDSAGSIMTVEFLDIKSNITIKEAIDKIQNQDASGDMLSALRNLGRKLDNIEANNYTINGITYDDGSNITDAVQTLIRAARVERRV